MVKLREAGIPVVMIAGNHDAANRMTRKLALPDNVRVLGHDEPETIVFDDLGVAIHGQSFGRAATHENLACRYPAAVKGMFNIGLLHSCVNGREGHEPYAPCTLDDMRVRQYDYWALGHIHKRETLCDDPPVVFPGNPQGRHVRESGPKGCVLVNVDGRGGPQIEPRWLDVFRWRVCRVDASGVESGYDLLDCVRRQLADALGEADGRPMAVRVQVEGACPAHRAVAAEPQRWTNEIRALAQDVGAGDLWLEKVAISTSLPADLDPSQWAEGPLGELVQYVTELKSSPEQLTALGEVFRDLRDRLPPELTEGAGALRMDSPETLRGLLDQVEQMLVHQLLSREGGK
jgi:DNA repair exonuclease SbcCD nuclease subunit